MTGTEHEASRVAERRGGPPTVLVVDDTEGNRYTVSRLLRGAGMRVAEAATAADAFAQLQRAVPDLVVLDINLPDASGFDVARTIKTDAATASVPILHVSASFVSNADKAFGLEYGADAYLTHPLDPAVFVATVRALLRAEGERVRQYQTEHAARRVAEQVAARATLLQHLTAELARTMSAEEVSQVVLTRAFAALGAEVGMMAVVVDDGRALEMVGSVNIPDDVLRAWRRFPVTSEAPMAEAVRTAAVVAATSREAMKARYPAREDDVFQRFSDGPESLYSIPMIVDRGPGQRVLGAMTLVWTEPGAPDAEGATLIAAVADQCALALERARLYDAERAARAAAEAAQAQAEEANEAKARFLTTMSHELRTPLNAIAGYAQLLEMGVRGPVTPEQQADLARIQRSQEHLLGLVNSVLNYARLDAGQVSYEMTDVPLGDTVATVDALVAPQMAAKGLALTVVPCDPALRVRADAEKLRQILLNLLTNATKFTPRGGRVTVTCETPREAEGARPVVEVRVADTGIGIAPSKLESVFDPFVQVGRALNSSDEGVGLGLSISRDLARAMGGELAAESVTGAGSTFTLTLPRV